MSGALHVLDGSKWSLASKRIEEFILKRLPRVSCEKPSTAFARAYLWTDKSFNYADWMLRGDPNEATLERLRGSTDAPPVLVVFDEAANLGSMLCQLEDDRPEVGREVSTRKVSMLTLIRWACRNLAQAAHKIGVSAPIFVAVSTISSMGEVVKPESSDDSLRVRDRVLKLQQPLTGLHGNMDLLADMPVLTENGGDLAVWACGRPLWRTLQGAEAGWQGPIELVGLKLQGGAELTKLSLEGLCALTYCRVPVLLPHIVALKAVRSHMATALKFESSTCIATYASEPALAAAAAAMCKKRPVSLRTRLTALANVCSASPLSAGGVGEMLACVLLLEARDSCCTNLKGDPFQAVDVGTFLEALAMNPIAALQKELATTTFRDQEFNASNWSLPGGAVRFNHFVHLDPNASSVDEVLRVAWSRCAAILLPPGWPAGDLLIPVRTAGNAKAPLGGIIVQVKNWQDSVEWKEFRVGLAAKLEDPPRKRTELSRFMFLAIVLDARGLKRQPREADTKVIGEDGLDGGSLVTPAMRIRNTRCLSQRLVEDQDGSLLEAIRRLCTLDAALRELVAPRWTPQSLEQSEGPRK